MRSMTVVGWPLASVTGLTAINVALAACGVIAYGYISPYVALVAVIANRICVKSGIMAAFVAVPEIHAYVLPSEYSFTLPALVAYLSMFVVAFAVAPTSGRPKSERIYDAGAELPFTSKGAVEGSLHGTGVRFWDVEASADWAADCDVGAEYARLYLGRIKTGETRPLIAWIVADMVRSGKFGGVETGFIQVLGQPSALAIRAASSVPKHDPDDGRLH